MVVERYVVFGKQYVKLGLQDIIKEGACHSLGIEGKIYPIVGVDTIGDIPASFSKDRIFYNPVIEKADIVDPCPLCKNLDPCHCERTDLKKFSQCVLCGRLILTKD